MLSSVIVEPKGSPAIASVIWLHGLGADGNDFVPIIPHLKLPASLPVRFIFPHAPVIPVTCNNGFEMRSWYDILELTEIRKVNEAHLIASANAVTQLINAEIKKGIAPENILLIGFSQGGAVALHAGLRFQRPLAGIFALSTYMATAHTLKQEASDANREITIHLAHGQFDDMVTRRATDQAKTELESHGYKPEWHEYSMGHEVCLKEIRDISRWMQVLLAG